MIVAGATEKANASTAAAAAATSGQRNRPSDRRSGDSSARPAPMHAPAMTSDALGRMNPSIRLGRKKAGRPKATTTGSQRPRRSENGLSAGAVVGNSRVSGTVYYLHAA